jgi:hypothetical protein
MTFLNLNLNLTIPEVSLIKFLNFDYYLSFWALIGVIAILGLYYFFEYYRDTLNGNNYSDAQNTPSNEGTQNTPSNEGAPTNHGNINGNGDYNSDDNTSEDDSDDSDDNQEYDSKIEEIKNIYGEELRENNITDSELEEIVKLFEVAELQSDSINELILSIINHYHS